MAGRPRRLFHVVPRAAWDARPPGAWRPASLAREGFCHLSFPEQLAGTLAVHFAELREVVLLELDPSRLEGALVLEPSRGGEPFPHLYRAIEPEDVVAQRRLERRAGERWEPPRDLLDP